MYKVLRQILNAVIILASIYVFSIWLPARNHIIQPSNIQLNLYYLPLYALQSILRLLTALIISCILSIWLSLKIANMPSVVTARYLQIINILQSIPNTTFLSLIALTCIKLFNFQLGSQIAVLITIVTCQIWNMILDGYQLLSTPNKSYDQVIKLCQISPETVLWRIKMPQIINTIALSSVSSLSASWFMVVAAENLIIRLFGSDPISYFIPGLGGCLYAATQQGNLTCIVLCLLLTVISVLVYNQVIINWSQNATRSKHLINNMHSLVHNRFVQFGQQGLRKLDQQLYVLKYIIIIGLLIFWGCNLSTGYAIANSHVRLFTCLAKTIFTTFRVIITLLFLTCTIVPLACYIGLRNRSSQNNNYLRHVMLSLSALPISGLYGLIYIIVDSNMLIKQLVCIISMSISSFVYLFNDIIYAIQNISPEIWLTITTLQLSQRTKWLKVLFPCIVNQYFSSLITTTGAVWNATILCEVIIWKNNITVVQGLGENIINPNINNLELVVCMLLMSLSVSLILKAITRLKNLTNQYISF